MKSSQCSHFCLGAAHPAVSTHLWRTIQTSLAFICGLTLQHQGLTQLCFHYLVCRLLNSFKTQTTLWYATETKMYEFFTTINQNAYTAINRRWSPSEIKFQSSLNFTGDSFKGCYLIVTGPHNLLLDGNSGNTEGCFNYGARQHKVDSQGNFFLANRTIKRHFFPM